MIGTIVFGGLCWGALIHGNYHIRNDTGLMNPRTILGISSGREKVPNLTDLCEAWPGTTLGGQQTLRSLQTQHEIIGSDLRYREYTYDLETALTQKQLVNSYNMAI